MCPQAGAIRKGVIQVTAAERLMDQFRQGAHTAVAIHDPSNMFYLTEGYTGEGVVYLSEAILGLVCAQPPMLIQRMESVMMICFILVQQMI